jgi:hypothetical protein
METPRTPRRTVIALQSFPLFTNALEDLNSTIGDIKPNFLEPIGPRSKYVDRPVLESEILRFSLSKMNDKVGSYVVLIGPKGGGKSTVVAKVFEEKKGVINMILHQVDTSESFLRRLLLSCGKIVEENTSIGLEFLIPILRSAAEKRNDLPISFIIEVESSSLDVLEAVKSIAKYLAIAANVIIILSEANDGLAFSDDKRQRFIWVDEMSDEEAKIYARKFKTNVSDSDLDSFLQKVGKLPLDIGLFMRGLADGKSANGIIDQV